MTDDALRRVTDIRPTVIVNRCFLAAPEDDDAIRICTVEGLSQMMRQKKSALEFNRIVARRFEKFANCRATKGFGGFGTLEECASNSPYLFLR